MRRGIAAGIAAAALLLAAGGCALNRLERALDPESREFLSKVRYLITGDERSAFLKIPAGERPAFIETFWKNRDPNPYTEENEFKIEYEKRITTANHLFTDGAEPGWLQDRGRIYILLGPPWDRYTYPRGVTFYGLPTEFWYYGGFEIIFVDERWTGDYRLAPTSAAQLGAIMSTQLEWKPQVEKVNAGAGGESPTGGLECQLTAESRGGGKALVRVLVPYKAIWLKADTAGKEFQTTLAVSLDASDESGKKAWELKKDYALALAKDELDRLLSQTYAIEIEAALKPGTYTLSLLLENRIDGSRARQKAKIVVSD